MNYDGQPIRQAFKLLSNPVFICEDDLTYPVGDILLDIPNYSKSNRIILQKSVLSIRLQYKFTVAPLLFVLKVVDIRTGALIGESPYGQEDFSTDWNTMNEVFLLDEFDNRYVKVHLIMAKDDTQSFLVRKRSFLSINTI